MLVVIETHLRYENELDIAWKIFPQFIYLTLVESENTAVSVAKYGILSREAG